MRHRNPPRWCPDAIATNRGWKHPKTGELLVSVKGLVVPVVIEIADNPEPVENTFVELETKESVTFEMEADCNIDDTKSVNLNVELETVPELVEEEPNSEKPKKRGRRSKSDAEV